MPAVQTLRGRLETKAWSSQTIVAQNAGDRPASTESWPDDGKATHAGQSGMAATRGNDNVDLDKLLNDDDDDDDDDDDEEGAFYPRGVPSYPGGSVLRGVMSKHPYTPFTQ